MSGSRQEVWSWMDTGPADACTNMALDEVLLRGMGEDGAGPLLRFYTWSRPAVSVGYFQDAPRDLDLALCAARGWAVVRRLTGGRAVFHDHELTYSIFLPPDGGGVPRRLLPSYRYLSEGLVRGLRSLGAEAELTALRGAVRRRISRSPGSPDCFASASWYEISVGGKKLVGSAQKRTPRGILQQGSLLLSTRRFHEYYEVLRGAGHPASAAAMTSLAGVLGRVPPLADVREALLLGFREAHGITFAPRELTSREGAEARALAVSRYGRDDWNLFRKPPVFKAET